MFSLGFWDRYAVTAMKVVTAKGATLYPRGMSLSTQNEYGGVPGDMGYFFAHHLVLTRAILA